MGSKGVTKYYDFRSDTTSIPTEGMLKAMMEAEVGDDVFDEDPTVHALQEKVAKLCGKEKGIFVCTGVMSNQLAIRMHVTELTAEKAVIAQTVICDARSHIYEHEFGGMAFLSGVQPKPIDPTLYGKNYLTAELIEKHIFTANDMHTPITTLICLENTLGGKVLPLDEIKKIRDLANKHGLRMHLDGARVWNAAVALDCEMSEITQYFDSVSLCLSKGLGIPIGSVLVSRTSFIDKVRQYRKLFGGGWRQAGYLAACGIYAIDNHWKRMKEDNENCKFLREELLKLGFTAETPETNILWVDSTNLKKVWEDIIARFDEIQEKEIATNSSFKPIKLMGEGNVCRFVTHIQTPRVAVERLIYLLTKSLQ